MAGLFLNHVWKRYSGNQVAVRDFHLEIQDKEFVVFVGPSGCGKSTTLRMIAGLEDVSDGEIYIGDKIINDLPPKARDIAMVFQNYALYPNMDVFENMAFGLRLRKMPKSDIELSVKRGSRTLEIEHLLERKPGQMSGGQRQRVALGRAIVRKPQVFLMDEPLSNLDAKLRVHMRAEIIKLQKELETTMIYVTHDQIEAMTMGTRIVVMKDGVVQQVAPPEEIYDKPANMFVAGFIGTPPMNFVDGKIEEADDGSLHFHTRRLSLRIPEGIAKGLKKLTDKQQRNIVFGIRPENISVERIVSEAYPEAIFSGTVEFSELMGADRYVHLKVGGETVISRVNPRYRFQEGESIQVTADMNNALFFDRSTGERVGWDA